jgi:ribosomal peptide maturation radical SAM protein 1
MSDLDVCLVYLPYGPLERPSLALSLLKPAVQRAGFSCRLLYENFRLATRLGTALYSSLAWVREENFGEWTFSAAAFPDFRPDPAGYFARAGHCFARDEAAARGLVQTMTGIREQVEFFLEEALEAVLALRPRVVGCTSTFQQHCATLAFTRRLKERAPEIVTVVGGANCEAEMGVTTLLEFPWLDYVVSGEAEHSFPDLVGRLVRCSPGEALPEEGLPLGIMGPAHRRHPERLEPPPRAVAPDLEASPLPDYDDFMEALAAYPGRDELVPGLLVETSRGCWWGQKHHCTFCGLNGGSLGFRAKSPRRALAEIRHLRDRYGIPRMLAADNILAMDHLRTVLPELARDPQRITLFYEVKANLGYEQMQVLRDAGVTWIQPGIESFHDEPLKLMGKGTTSWINMQLMKWARELGITLSWNYLCGLPGERDEWYGEVADWLPAIEHLQPCKELRPIRYDRFSPYQAEPGRYGLKIRPNWAYHHIFPLPPEKLARLVYIFQGEEGHELYSSPYRTGQGDRVELGGPGRNRLARAIHEWHNRFFRTRIRPLLAMTEEPGRTLLLDTRSVASAPTCLLEGIAHRVHRVLHGAHALESIEARVNRDGGPPLDRAAIRSALEDLVGRRFVLRLGDRYLALALRGEVPALPFTNEEGYPGGWVVRSRARPRKGEASAPAARTSRKDPGLEASGPRTFRSEEPFPLESGRSLPGLALAWQSWGTPAGENAIWLCHPLTKDAHAAGVSPEGHQGWWKDLVGPGRLLDTRRYFVVCSAVLGGCGGSTGPASIDPATGRPWGPDFPVVTIGDMVRAQERLADHLGLGRLAMVAGPCFGGQQALEWAVRFPDRVARVAALGATPAATVHNVALFGVMARLIQADPDFAGGATTRGSSRTAGWPPRCWPGSHCGCRPRRWRPVSPASRRRHCAIAWIPSSPSSSTWTRWAPAARVAWIPTAC